ncbi:hypothetical protein N0V90_012825 [Kalmusia sp. IMI 367209]|nr:hypothetical protein N0V90_012825 [Kalmusia sp. IMI 367209]
MTPLSRPQLQGFTRNPQSPRIPHFLTTYNGAEMMRVMHGMQDPRAQATLTAALLLAPPAVSSRATVPDKAKKALNAFVGFRCYYINIPQFKDWPMKLLSQPMAALWNIDPNKSKWSLMTKAWSTIRDQIGKNKAPLDVFFDHVCPYLNILPPDIYFEQLGWSLGSDRNGYPTVNRDENHPIAAVNSGVSDEALSIEDLIRYCQSRGYAQAFVLDPNQTSSAFLGGSNAATSNVLTPELTIASTQAVEKRAAERAERQTKRQAALDTGITAFFRDSEIDERGAIMIERDSSGINGDYSGIEGDSSGIDGESNGIDGESNGTDGDSSETDDPTDDNDCHQIAQEGTDQNISADETFYNALVNIMTNAASAAHMDDGTQQSLSIDESLAMAGYDVDSLLPYIQSYLDDYFDMPDFTTDASGFRAGADADATLPDMDASRST